MTVSLKNLLLKHKIFYAEHKMNIGDIFSGMIESVIGFFDMIYREGYALWFLIALVLLFLIFLWRGHL